MYSDLKINDVERAFRLALIFAMDEYGESSAPVLQHYDYMKKGRKDTAVYFTVLNPRKVGNAFRRYDVQDADPGLAGHEEWQHIEADIHITIVSDKDPLDLAIRVGLILGSLPFIEAMRGKGIGVQSVSNMSTVHVQDDKDNFALECSFRLPVTFNSKIFPLTKGAEIESIQVFRV